MKCDEPGCDREVEIKDKCSTCYHRVYYTQVRRQKFIDYLGGHCVECGSTESLELDHIDRSKKTMNFSGNLTFGRPDVMKELENAQLLCRECHIEKSVSEKDPFTHGTMYGWMHRKCDCKTCQVAKFGYYQERNAARRKGPGYGPRFTVN